MKTVTIPQTEYFELLRYRELVQSFEDMLHEPAFRREFVNRVRSAEERIRNGDSVKIKSIEALDSALDALED